MVLREALPADAPEVTRLYRLLVPGDPNIEVRPERITGIAADPNNFLFLVGAAGHVRATGFVTLGLDPMYACRPFAVLENLIVDPQWRGRGCGRFLMEAVEAFCWSRGCTKIMLLSGAFRIDAHRFFGSLGFSGDKKRAFVKYRSGFGASGPDPGGG